MTTNKNLPTQNKENYPSKDNFEPAEGIVENGDDEPRILEPRKFNPEDCVDSISPEAKRAVTEYLRSEYLKSKVMYGNALSVGLSFATGSTNAVIKYAQTQDSLESLGYGLVTAIIAGALAKAGSYILYERPLKKLEQTRTKLSSLEK